MGEGCRGQGEGKPPVILQSFAAKEIRPGETWKIYLRASDPEGDMKTIVCTIDQAGAGTYPATFIPIAEGERKDVSGFIYLTTFQSQGLAHLTLTLTVQIQDRAGNYSPPVGFPLRFSSAAQAEPPPEGAFQDRDLGPIMIRLVPLQPSAA